MGCHQSQPSASFECDVSCNVAFPHRGGLLRHHEQVHGFVPGRIRLEFSSLTASDCGASTPGRSTCSEALDSDLEQKPEVFLMQGTSAVLVTSAVIEHVHNHFDAHLLGTPAFISQSGARIEDIGSLLDHVPRSTTTVLLHVGTNDVATTPAQVAFERYKTLLGTIKADHPQVRSVYVTLVLPRALNRRRRGIGMRTVQRCNREAFRLNTMLRKHCQRTRGVFYVDHGLEWLPPARVMAADGLHPSFEGVVIIAGHLQQILLRKATRRAQPTWCDHAHGIPKTPRPPPTQNPSTATPEPKPRYSLRSYKDVVENSSKN
ncbi:hypothetical protein V5799_018726 [Amblyomma americanum]|uniref:C2H2-type domain-containing protein n=1 Tax=Amblyomma americanum TaxID=6943 RepID=A0AAQ4EZQ2_AMBAM